MALFIAAFDLVTRNNVARDYTLLDDAFEALDSHHVQDSVWFIESLLKQEELYSYFSVFMENRDRLIIAKCEGRPEYQNANAGTEEWLLAHGVL